MKAIVYTEYGAPAEVLRYEEVQRATPGEHEVLLRVRAASVNAMDWRMMGGRPWMARPLVGLRRPRITHPGVDVAGDVEAVGSLVTRFAPGDAVFGTCRGSFADYASAPQDRLVRKPANVTYEAAAATPVAAVTALQALRDRGNLRAGQSVLVDGAAGGVGTFAIQVARLFGATVTAVCGRAHVEAARALGAQRVIDYTREDFVADGARYDLVFAANAHRSIFDYRRVLAPEGTFVVAGGGGAEILQGLVLAPLLSLSGKQAFRSTFARLRQADLELLARWLAEGRIVPAIERRYALREAAAAIGYAAQGHAGGKLVVDVLRGTET